MKEEKQSHNKLRKGEKLKQIVHYFTSMNIVMKTKQRRREQEKEEPTKKRKNDWFYCAPILTNLVSFSVSA